MAGNPTSPPNSTSPPSPQSPQSPLMRKLKKGELLFAEGEKSRAMYLLRSGMIRLFLKKGDSAVEIDTIRAGQILGELAFLDGNPRSVSGEALSECELVEISSAMFMDVINKAPEWLKILLKTVVGRLRAANVRIRQLESTGNTLSYSTRDGVKTGDYQYITIIDFMKCALSILLGAARGTKNASGELETPLTNVQRYAHSIIGIPDAKITCSLDVLASVNIAAVKEVSGAEVVVVKDIDRLDQDIKYMNGMYQQEALTKQVSPKGFLILGLIAKHLSQFEAG